VNKIPKRLRVGAHVWKIVPTDALNEESGTTDHCNQTIHIQTNVCEDHMGVTLLHEILHVCCRVVGLDGDKRFTEEEFISRIDTTLHSILKQNKLF